MRLKPKPQAKIVALREHLGGSFNEAVNVAIDGLDDAAVERIRAGAYDDGFRQGVQAARSAAFAAGYAQARQIFRLTFPCPHCGHSVELRVGDVLAHLALSGLVATGLGHQDGCPELPGEPRAPDA